jgi:hypothetical protein
MIVMDGTYENYRWNSQSLRKVIEFLGALRERGIEEK